jgi:hypothetical protein
MTKSPSPTSDATAKEKLDALFNDQRLRNAQRNKDASTFQQFANSEAENVRGRFAAHEKSTVIGATPAPQYPAGPNWAHDPTGPEPPLGFDVNAIEPCGEYAEIEASLRDVQSRGQGEVDVATTRVRCDPASPTPSRHSLNSVRGYFSRP